MVDTIVKFEMDSPVSDVKSVKSSILVSRISLWHLDLSQNEAILFILYPEHPATKSS
jgi:hypothetical protein